MLSGIASVISCHVFASSRVVAHEVQDSAVSGCALRRDKLRGAVLVTGYAVWGSQSMLISSVKTIDIAGQCVFLRTFLVG